jgi:hypothetical protein
MLSSRRWLGACRGSGARSAIDDADNVSAWHDGHAHATREPAQAPRARVVAATPDERPRAVSLANAWAIRCKVERWALPPPSVPRRRSRTTASHASSGPLLREPKLVGRSRTAAGAARALVVAWAGSDGQVRGGRRRRLRHQPGRLHARAQRGTHPLPDRRCGRLFRGVPCEFHRQPALDVRCRRRTGQPSGRSLPRCQRRRIADEPGPARTACACARFQDGGTGRRGRAGVSVELLCKPSVDLSPQANRHGRLNARCAAGAASRESEQTRSARERSSSNRR